MEEPRRRRFRPFRASRAPRPPVTAAEVAAAPAGPRSRGIYILPNAFTTANLFAGFFAIVQAMNGRFEVAAVAIFVAMVFDSLDGRVARLTNTQSAFGEQYDSMSDMVSFGAAPALVVYEWSLRGMGKLGWLAAFVYCAGAALRLARFNANIGVVDKRYFQGLPSPAAAALVAGLVWIATDLRETRWIDATGTDLRWLAWAMTLYAGVTMVSNAPFYSFKDLNLKKSVPYMAVPLIVLAFVLVSSDPPIVLFDEATRSLDPGRAARIRRVIRELLVERERRAVLFATHDLDEARALSDEVVLLEGGRAPAFAFAGAAGRERRGCCGAEQGGAALHNRPRALRLLGGMGSPREGQAAAVAVDDGGSSAGGQGRARRDSFVANLEATRS
jgi:CDP-diacylglycerol--serine O-phosphatidyltransferase